MQNKKRNNMDFPVPFMDDDEKFPPTAPKEESLSSALHFMQSIKTYEDYKNKDLREFRADFIRVMEFAKRDQFGGKTEAEYR